MRARKAVHQTTGEVARGATQQTLPGRDVQWNAETPAGVRKTRAVGTLRCSVSIADVGIRERACQDASLRRAACQDTS